jgi:secreted PhoX family phosphatase
MALERSRREFLLDTVKATSVLAVGPSLLQMTSFAHAGNLSNIGPLQAPDANGIRLPVGFTSRVVARSGQAVAGYTWHNAPDGGATFPAANGGWVYTSNSEVGSGAGGCGAIQFNSSGGIVSARRILSGTSTNCAGGPTPWNTWLSCEEISRGAVWETFPLTGATAVRRPALGLFQHEAVALDPFRQHVYLTEDRTDGCLYRFIPSGGFPNLATGTLQVARVSSSGAVSWVTVPNPTPSSSQTSTRYQVSGVRRFNGGEGIWFHNGLIYFATKGDNRVWRLDTQTQILVVIYDVNDTRIPNRILSGVDNVTVNPTGDILVAEDGGDLQICVIDQTGVPKALLQVTGQSGTEITGPALSPNARRLYFSSQRGLGNNRGITYEISGQF